MFKFFDDEVDHYVVVIHPFILSNEWVYYYGCITKDGKVSRDIVDKKIDQINLVIKEHTNDEKIILYIDKLEANLPIIYIYES